MFVISRRKILGAIVHSVATLLLPANFTFGSDRFHVDHPLVPPSAEFSGQCLLCGMTRSMWARTWIEFDRTDGVSQVCSFHCLADLTLKSGRRPDNIKLAVYHDPKKMLASAKAVVVIGSTAKGTMSPQSKIVFADLQQANAFVSAHGGATVSFESALDIARAGVAAENKMLAPKRIKMGKIVEPAADDRCAVCEMYPQRYPRNRCQIHTQDKQIYQFCSTQCMFAFLKKPHRYAKAGIKPHLVWVTDYKSGSWISGRSAYYLVGARDVLGPMGFEALPFDKKSDAYALAGRSGGRILLFGQVTIESILER